jgi:LEA14-like dessication related protein
MTRLGRLVAVLSLLAVTSGCALSLRNPHVSDLNAILAGIKTTP